MKITSMIVALVLTAPLAGCLIRTGPPGRTVVRERRACPPAHHWEGGVCVHNGHGHGNGGHGHGHGHGHDHDRD
jgi:hypothetical protein